MLRFSLDNRIVSRVRHPLKPSPQAHTPVPTITLGKAKADAIVQEREKNGKFDTPSLIECWRTAPYLHDGRYATIHELLVAGKHGQVDGRAADLNRQQVDDLIEFVLSL